MRSGLRVKEIIDGIFVGELSESSLVRKNIKHVILLNESDIRFEGVKYFSIPVDQSNIVPACQQVHAILERNTQRQEPRNILVYCDTGRDKSVCAIAYYLKKSDKYQKIDQAIEFIKQRRRPFGTKPSELFITQIKEALDEKDDKDEPDNTDNE